jgi:phosphatidate cytidylyltransferase
MLRQRILTAALLLPTALAGVLLLPNGTWTVVVAGVMGIGGWEWGGLAGWRQRTRIAYGVLLAVSCGGLGLLVAGGWTPGERLCLGIWGAAVALWVLFALPAIVYRWHLRRAWIMFLTGWWVLVPAGLAVARLQRTALLLLALMAIVWIADTAAFFAGRAFGRVKLAPLVSPGKTWEGVAGAMLAVLVYFMIVGALRSPRLPDLLTWGAAALFFGVAALSIVGDLFESWVKREAGVKDSSGLLPGHGGVLDRIDALTSSLPLAALGSALVLS